MDKIISNQFPVHFLINDSGHGQPASGSLWTAIR